MKKRVVIVGAGISGLTAGLYLLRYGYNVKIIEKNRNVGGLVHSFIKDGFYFDTGPRAFGNAGILIPFLDDLGIDLKFVKGLVSTGFCNEVVHHVSKNSIDNYINSLKIIFPESLKDIEIIKKKIKKYSTYAEILNRVPNPFFRNLFRDTRYIFKELIPWLPTFFLVVLKISFYRSSIESTLYKISRNSSLNDMVSQHFFKGTPANFALGYFENYKDYLYPLGGTGELPKVLYNMFIKNGGEVLLGREVHYINPYKKIVRDSSCELLNYEALLWSADLKMLYSKLANRGLRKGIRRKIYYEQRTLKKCRSGESVFSLFVASNLNPEYFSNISNGHFIYTPLTRGLGDLHRDKLDEIKNCFPDVTKEVLFTYLDEYCKYNSYEISIPVLKDSSLAPQGKTGLVISLLFDGELFKLIKKSGWYSDTKKFISRKIIKNLDSSIYPGLDSSIIFTKSSTPLTLLNMFNTNNGAITGWSMEGKTPVADSLLKISKTPYTPIPNIFKAGQWSYSPSGVPVSILTGRIAAWKINLKQKF